MFHRKKIGLSVLGKTIWAWSNFPWTAQPDSSTLIIGGIHGNEPATGVLLKKFISTRSKGPNLPGNVVIIPIANPDGYHLKSRFNARNVDINRNFPRVRNPDRPNGGGPYPLSEPESEAIHHLILNHQPARIISLHWELSEIDADGKQSLPLAKAMRMRLSEREKRFFGLKHSHINQAGAGKYRGSLGQWCGHALIYPNNQKPQMVTIELPYTYKAEEMTRPLPPDSWERVTTMWRQNSNKYIDNIKEPVFKMLLTGCK